MTTPVVDAGELNRALADADVRVLLMSLVHMTGDRKWITAPYLPKRDVRLVADIDSGFEPELAAEIRAAVASLLTSTDGVPLVTIEDPGVELMIEMMSVCLGEVVPPEYVPMARSEMGFESVEPTLPRKTGAPRVLIIGAGINGLGLAYRLRELGVEFEIVEKNETVGGTWWENRYPGCGVDTPNHFYSYSHSPNHGWRHYFSLQGEIHGYIDQFARTNELTEKVRFNTTVTSVVWDESTQHWRVEVSTPDGRDVIEAPVVVSAIGHFNRPVLAQFEGAESFVGPLFHSAQWPSDIDLRGKNVAVIGTGASSMQIVPKIADDVKSLTIYQRSAQWARHVPELNDEVRPGASWLLSHLPYYYEWYRFTLFWRYGDGLLRFLKKDPEWPHPDRSLNRINDRHRQEMTDHITAELAERPDLIEKCLPTYPPYGKRILLDKGWFKTLLRDHVELVTEGIERFDATGITTSDGTHRPTDIAIVATGFSVTDQSARLGVVGRNGRTLAEEWADDNPRAYLGITVPGFPNFFCMYGPNTNAGHGGSAFLIGECQTRYITSAIVALAKRGGGALEAKTVTYEEYVSRVDAEHETLIWTHPGMSTYYRNRHGRVVSPMPFRLVDYFTDTLAIDLNEFDWTPPTLS